MLRIFVPPEKPIWVILANPILVHVSEEIELAIGLKPLVNRLALVSWHRSTVGLAIGRVRAWGRIVLTAEVTILRIRPCEC